MNDIGNEQPPVRVNLADADDVVCDKCGDRRFEQIFIIKRVSPLMTPLGKEQLVPIGPPISPPIFACYSCGHVNEAFLPAPLRAKKEPENNNTQRTDLKIIE